VYGIFFLFTRLIYEDLVQWENRVVLLFIAFLEEREFVEKFGRMNNELIYTFPLLHANHAEKPHLSSPITT
jgi:hypothetical protein